MKYFVAIFLFAFVAGIRAKDFEDLFLEDEFDGGDPDRHPYVQCKIDLYDCIKAGTGKLECLKAYKTCMAQLIPTIPPFVRACSDERKKCLQATPGLLAKRKCYYAFFKCLVNKGPAETLLDASEDNSADRHPYVQCKIDLYDCIKAATSKLECLKTYKTCMAQLIPTIPPFVIACKDDLKKCLSSASGILGKGKCYKAFAGCLKNKGSGAVVLDAIEDVGQMEDISGAMQCKKDLYKCVKEGKDKKGCLKDYRDCMTALIPPYVKQCYAEATKCFNATNWSDWRGKVKCAKKLATCLKNGASTQSPPEPSTA